MSDKVKFWDFDPRYSRGEVVWWVDERLRFGRIVGLYFENTDKLAIMYQVEESSGVVSKWHDVSQTRLFPSKDALLTHLESLN
jgi:hypothetical protein